MKKVIRLTESDLRRIVKRIIKEDEDYTPSYDIRSFDCGNDVRSGSVYLDGETIVIGYCRGNEEDLEYLKEKGLKLLQWEYSLPEGLNENKKHRLKEDVSEYHTDGWANYEKMPVKYFVDSIVDEFYHVEYGDVLEDMSPEQVAKHIESEKESVLNDLSDMVFGYLGDTPYERRW